MALLRRLPDGRRRIDVLGELIVALALSGNAKMIRLVCDRIDGRPTPPLEPGESGCGG